MTPTTPTTRRTRTTVTRRSAGGGGMVDRRVLSVLLGVLWAAPLAAQHTPRPSSAPDPVAVTAGVRPGDVIRVWIWREQDYSGEFPVDARGTAVLPLLGEVRVPGKTAEQLSDTLHDAYRKYLKNPSIQVTVLRWGERRRGARGAFHHAVAGPVAGQLITQ